MTYELIIECECICAGRNVIQQEQQAYGKVGAVHEEGRTEYIREEDTDAVDSGAAHITKGPE